MNSNNKESPIVVATSEEIKGIVIAALQEYLPKPLFGGDEDYSDDELLSRDETAEMLGVNVSTLWRWAKDKSLPCVHVGRLVKYKRSTVRQYMQLHEGR